MNDSHARLQSSFRELVAALRDVLRDTKRHAGSTGRAVLIMALTGLQAVLQRASALLAKKVEPTHRAPVLVVDPGTSSTVRAVRRHALTIDRDSVIPPNIERAVASQLKSSHRDRIDATDFTRFLASFGIAQGDIRGALLVLKSRERREHVTAKDLQEIQAWITKGWVDAQRRRLGASFDERLREQLGVTDSLEHDTLVEQLKTHAYRDATARDIARRVLTCHETVASARLN